MSFIVDYNITKFQINQDSVVVFRKLLNRYIVQWDGFLLLYNNNVINQYFTDQSKGPNINLYNSGAMVLNFLPWG